MGRHPIALSPEGCAQVAATARFAAAIKPDLIVTSPLVRARQSAEILSEGMGGIEIVEDADIAEVLYGRWEGLTYHDLIDDEHYVRYRKAPHEMPTPGGETIAEVQARGRCGGDARGGGESRAARPVRLAWGYHPDGVVPFHDDGDSPLPSDPRG